MSFRVTRRTKIIVVAGEQWRGRSSAGEIHSRIRCWALFEMGKACFSWRPRPKTRSAKDFPRGIRRLRWNAPRDNRVDGKTVCCLINVQPFIRVATEGHLSGFLNYLVRKFLFLRWEFCSEWKEGAFETLFGETSDATRSSHFRWPTFYFKSFVPFAIQEVRSINIIFFFCKKSTDKHCKFLLLRLSSRHTILLRSIAHCERLNTSISGEKGVAERASTWHRLFQSASASIRKASGFPYKRSCFSI